MEAAVVFPIVLLVVAAILSMLIQLYLSVSNKSSIDLALRAESGQRAGTMTKIFEGQGRYGIRQKQLKELILDERMSGFYPTLELSLVRSVGGKFLINETIRTEEGIIHVYDEAEFIRKANFIQ